MSRCVAELAEGDEVFRVVVGGVAVDVVDVKVLAAAADGAPSALPLEDQIAQAFPCAEGVLLLRRDPDREAGAEEAPAAARGVRAADAEGGETVEGVVPPAQGRAVGIEGVEGELDRGRHGRWMRSPEVGLTPA